MSKCSCSNSDLENFVDITGLCDSTSIDLSTYKFWTQISVPQLLKVPEQKPDIEELNGENISVKILRKKLILTPISLGNPPENLEGKILTGYKLVIEGLVCNAISYTALVPDQAVHTAHIDVPFSAFVVLPAIIDGKNTVDLNLDVIPCIEDVFIKEVCKRQIFLNVTLFLQVVPAPGGNCENLVCDNVENILIKGVTSPDILKTLLTDANNTWTQMDISESLSVPHQKPDIEQLVSLFSKVDIISQKVVKTPIPGFGNQEGTNLTGRKLIIEGVIRQKIIYTADVPSQSLHSVHFDIPFSAFVVIDETTAGSARFKVEPYIEDIFICAINKRQIFKNTTLFIKVSPICG